MRSAGFCVFLFWILVFMSPAHASLPDCAAGREVVSAPDNYQALNYQDRAVVYGQQTFRGVIYLKSPMSDLGMELEYLSIGQPSPSPGDIQFKLSAQSTDALEATCAGITLQPFQNLVLLGPTTFQFSAAVQMLFVDITNNQPVHTLWALDVAIRLFHFPYIDTSSLLGPEVFYQSLARLVGDPHATTWDGVTQTVFAEGDFVLVESPATGLALHSRHCKAAVGHWASWTCELALRCDDSSDAMEISAAQWANATHALAPGMTVEELPGDVRKVTCSSGLIMLVMRQRFHRHAHLNVQLSVNFPAALDARGLLGTPNGDASDDVRSRSGEVLKADLEQGRRGQRHYVGHALEELDAIHESWRVRDSEKLFKHDMLPTPTSSVHPTGARGMAVPGITTEAAKTRCRDAGLEAEADIAICVHDMVMFRHVDGAKNLAQFNEVVAKHM